MENRGSGLAIQFISKYNKEFWHLQHIELKYKNTRAIANTFHAYKNQIENQKNYGLKGFQILQYIPFEMSDMKSYSTGNEEKSDIIKRYIKTL